MIIIKDGAPPKAWDSLSLSLFWFGKKSLLLRKAINVDTYVCECYSGSKLSIYPSYSPFLLLQFT